MLIDVYLRDIATGESAIYHDEWENEESLTYIWEEGNYACDCNRRLFLCRALGRPDPDERPCSDDQIAVDRILDRDTGRELYRDDLEFMPLRYPPSS